MRLYVPATFGVRCSVPGHGGSPFGRHTAAELGHSALKNSTSGSSDMVLVGSGENTR